MGRYLIFLIATALSTAFPNASAAPPEGAPLAWISTVRNGITYQYTAADNDQIDRIVAYVSEGRHEVERFFSKAYGSAFVVKVFPSRASLTEHWRVAWNAPDLEAQCWMVASGTATGLTILSPRVWASEACEHDASDARHVREVITHELVHVFHGQNNSHPEFDGLEDLGWFVEGLAAYASGQLDDARRAGAAEAIRAGKAPAQLEDAWSGKYRYGVSGSIVAYLDAKYGRKALVGMLSGTTEAEILGSVKLTEAGLLDAWRDATLDAAAKAPR